MFLVLLWLATVVTLARFCAMELRVLKADKALIQFQQQHNDNRVHVPTFAVVDGRIFFVFKQRNDEDLSATGLK
jgi:hypothetical protein